MTETDKKYDLEERTFLFAKQIRNFVKIIPRTQSNIEDSKQLIRSSGSIAANYIEANNSLSKKDFVMRIRISRKEAKESMLWLKLLEVLDIKLINEQKRLINEASELLMILSAIMRKAE